MASHQNNYRQGNSRPPNRLPQNGQFNSGPNGPTGQNTGFNRNVDDFSDGGGAPNPPQTAAAAPATPQATGYQIIPPNQQKRNKILSQAEQEARKYEEFRANKPKMQASIRQPLGGGVVPEDVARIRQHNLNKAAPVIKKETRKEYDRRQREAEEAEIERKRHDQRRKAEENEKREAKRQEKHQQQYDALHRQLPYSTGTELSGQRSSHAPSSLTSQASSKGPGSMMRSTYSTEPESVISRDAIKKINESKERSKREREKREEELKRQQRAKALALEKEETERQCRLREEHERAVARRLPFVSSVPSDSTAAKMPTTTSSQTSQSTSTTVNWQVAPSKHTTLPTTDSASKPPDATRGSSEEDPLDEEAIKEDHRRVNEAFLARLERQMKGTSGENGSTQSEPPREETSSLVIPGTTAAVTVSSNQATVPAPYKCTSVVPAPHQGTSVVAATFQGTSLAEPFGADDWGATWDTGLYSDVDVEEGGALIYLCRRFPEYDCDVLQDLLHQTEGDIEAVINMLQ